MKRCQIDLVVFEKTSSKDENLKSKDTIEVANQLKEIFMTFWSPKILQFDKDSEFQGILPLIYCLHLITEQ